MGSYCLVIRRKIWIEQGLSFQMYKPKNWQAVGNYFDTADYANLQLIDSGYEVLIAPTNIREKLVCFTSISLWGLRIQETMGNISQIIRPRPNEYDKAYRTAITLKKLNEYLSINNFQNSTIKQEYIMRTIKICKSEMKDSVRKEINKDVMKKFNMLIKK